MEATLSDSKDESEEETTNMVMDFTGKYEYDRESSDEELAET